METLLKNIKSAALTLFLLVVSFCVNAQEESKGFTVNEPVDQNVNPTLIWGGVGGGFAIALIIFLIFKNKYEKKQRQRAVEQMKARANQPPRTRAHSTRKA